MTQSKEKKEIYITLFEILGLLKKYCLLIISVGLISAILTFGVCSLFMDPVYEAGAKMIVNSRRDKESVITNDQILSSKKLVDTYAIIIRSRTVLDPVIKNLNLDIPYDTLKRVISVSAVNDTQVMQISVKSKDKDLAEKIVNEILKISPKIILDAVQAGSVKVVESAYSLDEPVAPNKKLNVIVVSLLSMAVVFAVIILRHVLDNTYDSEVELRDDLNLPVMGVIPAYETCFETKKFRKGENK